MLIEDNEMEKPSFIYKYKGVSSITDLIRLLDIINNNRIFLPTYNQLNDPLEGQIISISTDAYAGYSMSLAADEEDMFIKDKKEKFKVLSLSEQWNNPQLWAHYANGYKGVCLCFSTKGVFGEIGEVEYCQEREEEYVKSDRALTKLIRNSFYKKEIGWSYEKEWRMITKSSKKYLQFKDGDLCGVILGHGLTNEVSDFIKNNINSKLLLMKTKVGYRSYNINDLPLNYEYDYNGVPIKILDVEKSLRKGRYIFLEK